MSTKRIDEINALFPDYPFIIYQPGLAHVFSVNEALVLGSLMYWSGKGRYGDIVYKTIDEMQEQTGLTRTQQTTAIAKLKKSGVLLVRRSGPWGKRHFYVHMPTLRKIIKDFSLQETNKQDGGIPGEVNDENLQTITKTTQRKRTKNTYRPSEESIVKAASQVVDLGYVPNRRRRNSDA